MLITGLIKNIYNGWKEKWETFDNNSSFQHWICIVPSVFTMLPLIIVYLMILVLLAISVPFWGGIVYFFELILKEVKK